MVTGDAGGVALLAGSLKVWLTGESDLVFAELLTGTLWIILSVTADVCQSPEGLKRVVLFISR